MLRAKALPIVLAILSISFACPAISKAADGHYKLLKEIPIGGGSGWDYLNADATGRRLYVTHGTKVVVVDTDTDKVVGTILDTPKVHGFGAALELKRGFCSNGEENQCSIGDPE